MANIIIHCYYAGKAGAVKGFFDEMQAGLQKDVYAEDGCVQYDYYLSAKDGSSGVLLEKWRDAAALDAHQKGEPMAKLLKVKEKYALETRVEIYELKE
ncbi:MAG: antibiotic biosynthesis monooxygenase [Oscillospiraceae bacterium]|nr:antibiotic biosynthesis monooxygenase [Oscillospiraceae bacterium]